MKNWYYENPLAEGEDPNQSHLYRALLKDEPDLAREKWRSLYVGLAAVTALHRHSKPTSRNNETVRVLNYAVDALAFFEEACPSLVAERDAAIEAVKIQLGVIESDPDFSGVDTTKHCTDAARQLMERHNLWHINTDHVQDGLP